MNQECEIMKMLIKHKTLMKNMKKLINIEDENDNKTQTIEEDSIVDLNSYSPEERKSLRNRKAPEYCGEWANAVNKITPELITLTEALSIEKSEK